jgi:hypothetical protein
MIPNIYHFFYKKNSEDLDIISYFAIKSIIEINKPEFIYFNYDYLPNGFLWNKIEKDLTLKKINIPKKYINNEKDYFNIYKYSLIYKELKNYGGIFLDLGFLCLKSFKELLDNSYLKSVNNELIMAEKDNDIVNKLYNFYVNKKSYKNNKINILDPIYYGSKDIFNEINDYSFGQYFHLIKNCYFISFNNHFNKNMTIQNIFNQITTYNLLIRYILTYNFFNKSIEYINDKIKLINNIDIIYWINLEKSIDRKKNMEELLSNIDIPNERINAIDGFIEDNISTKYFYEENNIYPNYCNKEYAILLSHLNTIYKFANIKENLKYGVAMICEDDLSFDFINYWKIDLKNIIEEAPNDWEIIMLGYFSLKINRKNIYEKWNNEWSAICYLINYKKIQKINDFKKDEKWICKKTDLMVSDNYIFSKFTTYVYKYPYMTFPNDNSSTFHIDHLNYHKLYKASNYIVLENMYEEYSS